MLYGWRRTDTEMDDLCTTSFATVRKCPDHGRIAGSIVPADDDEALCRGQPRQGPANSPSEPWADDAALQCIQPISGMDGVIERPSDPVRPEHGRLTSGWTLGGGLL